MARKNKRNKDWNFNQCCLLGKSMQLPKMSLRKVASLVSFHGPSRKSEGVKAEAENILGAIGFGGRKGLRHGGSIGKTVLTFMVNNPKGFDRYCKKLGWNESLVQ